MFGARFGRGPGRVSVAPVRLFTCLCGPSQPLHLSLWPCLCGPSQTLHLSRLPWQSLPAQAAADLARAAQLEYDLAEVNYVDERCAGCS